MVSATIEPALAVSWYQLRVRDEREPRANCPSDLLPRCCLHASLDAQTCVRVRRAPLRQLQPSPLLLHTRRRACLLDAAAVRLVAILLRERSVACERRRQSLVGGEGPRSRLPCLTIVLEAAAECHAPSGCMALVALERCREWRCADRSLLSASAPACRHRWPRTAFGGEAEVAAAVKVATSGESSR